MAKRNNRILLVEDNDDDVELTLRAFRQIADQSDIVVARDGEEACSLLFHPAAELPHVILLDLKLPKLDGIEVLEQIRAHERTRALPVVVLTSSNERVDVTRCYELGASAFIRKPVDQAQLAEVARVIGAFWLVTCEPPP